MSENITDLVQDLDDTVTRDCVKSTPYTRGRVIVLARLLEQAIKEHEGA